jgi:hypothetical protein
MVTKARKTAVKRPKTTKNGQKWAKKAPKTTPRTRKMTTATAAKTETSGKYPAPSMYRWFAGPYVAPPSPIGAMLHDEMLGDVKIVGKCKPLSWPVTDYRGGEIPILCGDLVRAVCEEEEMAVAHYWGVSKYIVNKWREAIAGEKVSSLVHTALAIKRHDPKFRKKWGYRD